MKKILEAILNTFRPALMQILFEWFCKIFNRIKPVEKLATVLQTLYIPVDAELETIAKETDNKEDDLIVTALKTAIETVAAQNNITLQNVDND